MKEVGFPGTARAILMAATVVVALPAVAENHAEEAMAGDTSLETVVATVGETKITVGHVIAATSSLTEQQLQIPPVQLFEGLVERLIQQEAVAQNATDISAHTELQLDNERRSLIASQVVENIAANIAPTAEELKAAYDRRFADFVPDTEYNASHILVETEEEALAIVGELKEGADFAATAREKSTGPSGPNGGNLGWFGPGRMVPAFEAAVVDLDIGAISDPVETQFGWHVIILNDSRIPSVPTFEELQVDLAAEVTREIFNTQVQEMIDAATVERMNVGVDPMVLFDPTILLAPNE